MKILVPIYFEDCVENLGSKNLDVVRLILDTEIVALALSENDLYNYSKYNNFETFCLKFQYIYIYIWLKRHLSFIKEYIVLNKFFHVR